MIVGINPRTLTVGIVRPRLRRDSPAVELKPAHHASTREDALRIARTLLAGTEPAKRTSKARPSVAPVQKRLKPQARHVLHHLIARGSLSQRQAMGMNPPCYRLAARVAELREVFGAEAITTESEPHEGGTHARYVWRGERAGQLELTG